MLNRTRLSSLDAFGLRDQRNRIYPALEASDGSTLSLDFTQMSSLDSRFTFSRTSTATYINSQGLVQYADHNLFTNTAWLGSTLPTNWNPLIGSGTITWNANGSVTMTAATSQRPAIYHSTITTINPGMPHTFGYLATGVSGSPTISQIINSSIAGETYAINGVTVSSSTVVQSNDVVSCTFTPTTANVTPRIGPGVTSQQSNMSVTASRPQFNVGSSLQSYAANTSTTARYQAPRFAYNPTTLAPLGLMMEGNATNLVTNSQNITTSTWNVGGNTTLTANTTEVTDPAGGNTATKIELNANVYCYRAQQVTVLANTAYTFSFWIRGTAGSTQRVFEYEGDDLVPETTLTYTNTGWTRVQVQFTSASLTTIFVYVCSKSTSAGSSDVLYVWGGQLEAGTGATSYIPTATSSFNRASDQLTMSDISALGYSTAAGTFYYSGQFTKSNAASYPVRIGFMTAGDQPTWEVFTNTSRLFAAARGTGAAPEANLAFTLNTQLRFAASFDASLSTAEVKINLNGSPTSAGPTSLSATFTPTRLVIGRTGYEDYFPAGTIAQIKYWPTLKTAAELNLLTTT